MKNLFLVLPVLLLTGSSFAELPEDLAAIVDKLDSECSGNDNGYVGKFNPAEFNADQVVKELMADQAGKDANECRSNISESQAEGANNLLDALFGRNGENDCVDENLSNAEQGKLRSMIEDPTNLGVFSKEWDGYSGDSESCMYKNYDIYRADGTLISIVFNHTT